MSFPSNQILICIVILLIGLIIGNFLHKKFSVISCPLCKYNKKIVYSNIQNTLTKIPYINYLNIDNITFIPTITKTDFFNINDPTSFTIINTLGIINLSNYELLIPSESIKAIYTTETDNLMNIKYPDLIISDIQYTYPISFTNASPYYGKIPINKILLITFKKNVNLYRLIFSYSSEQINNIYIYIFPPLNTYLNFKQINLNNISNSDVYIDF